MTKPESLERFPVRTLAWFLVCMVVFGAPEVLAYPALALFTKAAAFFVEGHDAARS